MVPQDVARLERRLAVAFPASAPRRISAAVASSVELMAEVWNASLADVETLASECLTLSAELAARPVTVG